MHRVSLEMKALLSSVLMVRSLMLSLLVHSDGYPVNRSQAVLKEPSEKADIATIIELSRKERMQHLERQAIDVLNIALEKFEHPILTNSMNVGGCILIHLLSKMGALSSSKVQVMVVDTYHLFDETMAFLAELESTYRFHAEVFGPAGISSSRRLLPEHHAEFERRYGSNLWKEDIVRYDRVCKLEPFERGLKQLHADALINGRRRDHGGERAYIDVAEVAPVGGGLVKLNPLAYWSFEDCLLYASQNRVPVHPSIERGYPSQGDAKDTVPVPDPEGLSGARGEAGSVRWVRGVWTGVCGRDSVVYIM